MVRRREGRSLVVPVLTTRSQTQVGDVSEMARSTPWNVRLGSLMLVAGVLGGCAGGHAPTQPSSKMDKIVTLRDETGLSAPVTVPVLLDETARQGLPPDSLRGSLAQTVADSPLVREALYGLASTSIGIAQTDAQRGVSLGLTGNYGRSDQSGTDKIRPVYLLGVSGSYTLFDGMAARLQVDRVRWQALQAVSALNERLDQVSSSVIESVIRLHQAREALELARRHVQREEEVVAQVRRLTELGTAYRSDLPEAEARLEQQKQEVVAAQQALTNAAATYRRLTGHDAALDRLELPAPLAPAKEDPFAATVLDAHPTVKLADAAIQAAIAQVLSIDAQRNGRLVAQIGTTGWASYGIAKLVALGNAIVSYSVSLLDGGERDARLRAAVADLEVALAQREDSRRSVLMGLQQAEAARQAAAERALLATREQDLADRVARIKRTDYDTGLVDLKSLLDIEQQAMGAESRRFSARWEALLADYQSLAARGALAQRLEVVTSRTVVITDEENPFPVPTLLDPPPPPSVPPSFDPLAPSWVPSAL